VSTDRPGLRQVLTDTLFQFLAQLVDTEPAKPPCLCRHAPLSAGWKLIEFDEIEANNTGFMLSNS
jgi:hypothetical protein